MSKIVRRTAVGVAFAMAIVGAACLTAATSALAQTKITVGRTTGSGFHIPLYIAIERGFLKKEGLEPKVMVMGGAGLRTAGVSGDIDFVPIPGAGSQAMLKGAPLRFVVGESLISQWALVTRQNVKSVEELKGKTLGYGRPGGAEYDEGDIVLSHSFHMEVGRDYKVISMQNEPDRIAALINGDIQGALVSLPTAAKAKVLGYKILIKTGEYLPRVGGTIWTRAEFIKKNPDTVRRFIRAIAHAEEYLRDNKEGSVPVIEKNFKMDAKQAGAVWDELHNDYGPDIPHKLLVDLFESRYQQLVSKGLWPKDKKMPDVEQFVARDLLSTTLQEMGYYLQRPPKVQGKPS